MSGIKPSEQVAPTLENCADEPIHIPGAIQNWGVLVGLNAAGTITHVGGELPGLFNCDSPVGKALDEIAPELSVALDEIGPELKSCLSVNGKLHALRLHHTEQGIRVLEIEPDADLGTFPSMSFRQMLECKSVNETLQRLTSLVREVAGYDRVVAYMFDPDLNGTVVAEDQRPELHSYLHQRFPASDIPPQAMRLYKRKLVRMIVDTSYEPQPIHVMPGSVWPLDLSDTDLRSVSPIHIEYLQNMGVAGTLVCTLMAGGEVLGMLTCHHLSPRFITPTLRDAVGSITAAAAQRVQSLRMEEYNKRRAHSYQQTAQILIDLTNENASPEGLGTHVERVQHILDAEGVGILLGGRVFSAGKVPNTSNIVRISEALAKIKKSTVQHTDHLASVDASFEPLADCAAGVVRCALAGEEGDAVLWFRPEVQRSVSWAGNPSNSMLKATAPGQQLTPRASFEAYIEKITGRSLLWQPWELDAAEAVRALVSNIAWQMRGLRELAIERERTNHELAEARDAALAASKAKTDFLTNMSHEIRTPMTAILGYTDLLAGEFHGDPEQSANALRTIKSNASHLLSLINDILDVSKIEAGQMKVETIETRPVEIIEKVAGMVRPRATSKNIDFKVEYETDMPATIHTDPTRLSQILLNLVGNAIKFTQSGAITIRVACDPKASSMQISVADTGVGLSPEQVERLSRFEAFTQADESTTRLFGGTGLGLRISNALATMLGGNLVIQSIANKGSTFTFNIRTGDLSNVEMLAPKASDQKSLETTTATTDQPMPVGSPLSGVRILLAEDGPDNQRLISFHLKKAGAKVEVVDDGLQAVAAVQSSIESQSPFDVVLMDMQMPNLDGYGATRQLRELGIRLPVLALTAHAMDGDRERCLDAGCNDYMTKPIDKSQLVATCAKYAKANA